MMKTLTIRKMEAKDVKPVVYLYQNYMNDSIIKHLGKDFLNLVWEFLVDTDYSLNFILEDRKRVVGYISGTFDSDKIFKTFFLRRGFSLSKFIFSNLGKIPKCLTLLLEMYSYLKNTSLNSVKAELLFITIHPEFRGKGWAKKLIFTILEEFKKQNISKVKVTTIRSNLKVNQLLFDLGFKIEKLFKFYNQKMCLYSFRF